MDERRRPRPAAVLAILAIVTLVTLVTIGVLAGRTTATTTSSTSTTTSTVPRERPEGGWAVASDSGRGVMVDIHLFKIGPATFRAVRLRARTTLLRWHVGLGDPNLYARVPADAGPRVDFASEGRAGVVALFNGGFKQSAHAGGAVVDGVTLEPLVRGRMTIALDAGGHWAMGVWGAANYPPAGFVATAYRQNLGPLVARGAPTALAANPSSAIWGSPLGNVPPEARTGLGVDAHNNLVYVATMNPVMPIQLARALVAAGVVTGMQLDINPFWPILGVPLHPVHRPPGAYAIQLSGSQHPASVYETGWTRDFFVALAEPSSWNCTWRAPGLSRSRAGTAQPQRLALVGAGCAARRTSTTTTSSPGPTSSVAPTTSTSPASAGG